MVEPLLPVTRSLQSRIPQARSANPGTEQTPAQPSLKGDRLILGNPVAGKERTDPKLRPTPIPPEGKLDYYRKRHEDFLARYPEAPPSPPSYYLEYGDLYVRRFTLELKPQLSEEGQAWLTRTGKNLQVAIEEVLARDPEIELDDAVFMKVAYETHSKAYLDGGLADLPIDDLIRVAVTPNLSDTVNPTGLSVMAETAEALARHKLAVAMDAPEELAAEVLHAIKTSPDLLEDVIKLLDTAENAQTLREGLLKLKLWSSEGIGELWDLTTRKMKDAIEALRKFQSRDPASA
jgi:hypothetical protein